MTDWLHCNTCFIQPGDGTKFLLTNCGHIYCEKCSSFACNDKCKMCGSVCKTTVLTGQMKPDIEVYFLSPQDLLKKSMKMMTQTIEVLDFQQNHRRRFISHLREQLKVQQNFVEKAQKVLSHYQEFERELGKIKEENYYLKRLINEKGLGGAYTRPLTPGPSGKQSPTFRATPKSSPHQNVPPTSRHLSVSRPVSLSQRLQHSTISRSGGAERITLRTPPSGGRMGTIRRTPSPQYIQMQSPKSVPHPMSFSGLQTPSPR